MKTTPNPTGRCRMRDAYPAYGACLMQYFYHRHYITEVILPIRKTIQTLTNKLVAFSFCLCNTLDQHNLQTRQNTQFKSILSTLSKHIDPIPHVSSHYYY